MKRSILSMFVFFLCIFISAQVVTTEPAFISKDYQGAVKIIFNPALGNGGMADATQCYAHTGIITSESANTGDWKFATPTWRGGEAKYQMIKEGSNWVLNMPNGLYNYYGCPTTTEIEKLAFVFNDGPNGSKEGKTSEGSDIFIDVIEAGLNIKIQTPSDGSLFSINSSTTITAHAAEEANLELLINNTSVKTASNQTEISFSKTFTQSGSYTIVAKATKSTQTKSDTIHIFVAGAPTTMARPAGTKDGINYYDNDPTKVTLVMYAMNTDGEEADQIFVLGDFNNWEYTAAHQMHKDVQSGYFWVTIENLKANHEYAFQYAVQQNNAIVQVDDAYATKILDPWNDKWIPNDVYPNLMPYPKKGKGIVSVMHPGAPEYQWSDATLNFQKPNKENLVIYEMWIYNFSPNKTIKAATKRIKYLKDLGVNAIELMPICEFDGNYSWGYNPHHYFAADKAYGTDDDYKEFIDECHKNGMAVIIDMVINHCTDLNSFSKLYPKDKNPWINAVAPHDYKIFNDFNHGFEGTQNYFERSLNYWIEEFKVDGYRMDVSHGLCGENCNDRIAIIDNYFKEGVQKASPDAYFILEHWEYSERQTLVNKGMLCWENSNNKYCQLAMGWLSDDNLAAGAVNKHGYVSYCESHDEERMQFKAQKYGNGNIKTSFETRINRVPLTVAFNVLLAGPKMLWMFEELGFDYSINSNEAGEVVGESARTSAKPTPEGQGWIKSKGLRMKAFQTIAKINALRTQFLPNVFLGNPVATNISGGKKIRSIQWGTGNQGIFVVGNFSASENQTATLPTGTWYSYLNNETSSTNGGTTLNLEPGELRIYTAQRFDAPIVPDRYVFDDFDDAIDQVINQECSVFPTRTQSVVFVNCADQVKSINAYNIQGMRMATSHNQSQIDLSNAPQGMYILVINTSNKQYSFKVMRQ